MPFTFSVLGTRSTFLVVVMFFLLARLTIGHLHRYALCVNMGRPIELSLSSKLVFFCS